VSFGSSAAFEGWEIKGRPSVGSVRRTVAAVCHRRVRGEVAVKDGKFVGKVGRGKLLKREPTHF
jgi:dihydropyrimidinase